ncbi:nuclear transport factor 2 family protein [Flavihumibacter rivuli]|uniref:nuclear transport factor 2 family protein n=1 Tax=Flavihumibacter rivuli TaxID=2838156 RepID=UPI001BDEBF1B|nr:nuclear transport factor 2 family protein [Flavihumibacter rivuli]ULQ57246.1 nuclear transport factor 2 family protein [Flavihumibacter rivuli]
MKKLLFWGMSSLFFIACNNQPADEKKSGDESGKGQTTAYVNPSAEFADPKYIEMGKQALAALSAGDVDGWLKNYADNAVYVWNSGDSISGKAAITAYWKKRRMEVIDSLTFSNHVFLPINVKQPQSVEQPGIWLLGWYQVNAKYKSGKSMTQWMHVDMHFNANDKVDRVIQYIDRVPINAAAPSN